MCTYARTIFDCKHQIWGRRAKLCTIGEDFLNGDLPRDCAYRKPHGLQSRKLHGKCERCLKLDEVVAALHKKLEQCRRTFEETWKVFGAAEADKGCRGS